jgi:hypothetical protein
MKTLFKRITSVLFAVFMLSASFSASAGDYSDFEYDKVTGVEMFGDLVFVRPVMLLTTLAGTVTFLVSLPFSLLGGNVGDAGEALVLEPAKYTFIRPLGDIHQKY